MMEKQDDEQVTTSVGIPVAALERMKKTVDITMLADASKQISVEIKESAEKGARRSIINIQKRVSVKIGIMIKVEIHNFDIVLLLSLFNLLHEVIG